MAKKVADNVRKLTRTGRGGSISVVLPAELVKALGWKDRQKVAVKKVNGALVVRDYKRRA